MDKAPGVIAVMLYEKKEQELENFLSSDRVPRVTVDSQQVESWHDKNSKSKVIVQILKVKVSKGKTKLITKETPAGGAVPGAKKMNLELKDPYNRLSLAR